MRMHQSHVHVISHLTLLLSSPAQLASTSPTDQVTQTFRAKLFIILRFKDGCLDSDLAKEFDGFPVRCHHTNIDIFIAPALRR